MINILQQNLIFNINCYYQIESQLEKIANGQYIAMLPELSLFAMKASSNVNTINWSESQNIIIEQLTNFGLSEKWIITLRNSLNQKLQSGVSIEEFRKGFLVPIELFVDMLLEIVMISDHSISTDHIVEVVLEDIFEKDYWEDSVIYQINTVRSLSSSLGLDKYFLLEFGKVLLRLN